jgi:cell division protease FtsH
MVVLLAGPVAEHVVFGAITTGASDDLKRVYELSRAMIAEYGMGTALMSRGLPADDYSVSDATRRLVDDEQQHLTDMAWRRALEVIVAHRPLLDALASTLLEEECCCEPTSSRS